MKMTINTAKTETDYDEEYEREVRFLDYEEKISLETKQLIGSQTELFLFLNHEEQSETIKLFVDKTKDLVETDDPNKDQVKYQEVFKSVLYPVMLSKIERSLKIMTIDTTKTEIKYDDEYEGLSLEVAELFREPLEIFNNLTITETKEVRGLMDDEGGFSPHKSNKAALANLKTLKSVLYPYMLSKIEKVLK